MKKILLLTTALACVLVTGCEEDAQQIETVPEITADVSGNISISRDGETLSIPYIITNPKEDGEISAYAEYDWISGFSYEQEGVVTATVAENTQTENRSAIVTLEYSYDGGGKSVNTQVNVIQDAAIAYDYTLEAGSFQGHYYGTRYGNNGEYNYYTWISDLPFDEYGRTQAGGTYYLFDMFAGAPGDEDNPLPPAGTYTLGESGSTEEFTFSREYTRVRATDTDGNLTLSTYFSEGTLTLSYGDGLMNIEARLTDTEGKYHHVTYSQPTPTYLIGDGGIGAEGYLTLERDLNIVPQTVTASFFKEESEGVMDVMFTFADGEYDSDEMTEPGSALLIEAFVPYDENGYIATGTYSITDEPGAAFTMPAGEMQTLLSYLFPYEVFTVYSDDGETQHYGFCTEGTMTVTGENGNYDIECNFLTADGHSVTCRYSGELLIEGVPQPLSQLTGDYSLDLSDAVASEAYYLGNYFYTNGGCWDIHLGPADGVAGDGFMTTLVAASMDFAGGIPTGTYEASASTGYAYPGYYLTGYMSNSSLAGTMYLEYDAEGNITRYAPSVSGDMKVENLGDGRYTISFDFLDDRGYNWDGTWTGAIPMVDKTVSAGSVTPQSVPCTVTPDGMWASPVLKKDRKGIAPVAGAAVTSAKR